MHLGSENLFDRWLNISLYKETKVAWIWTCTYQEV